MDLDTARLLALDEILSFIELHHAYKDAFDPSDPAMVLDLLKQDEDMRKFHMKI